VLAPEEVLRLIDAAQTPRDRVFLQVAYGCGLRLGELIHLRVTDIDSARMVVHVRHGKGAKDRLVPLSRRLLEELRGLGARVPPPPLAVSGPAAGATDHRQQHAKALWPAGGPRRPE